MRTEKVGSRSLTHGATRDRTHTREYCAWIGARRRCEAPKTQAFEHYGGRGIRVLEPWRSSFSAFLKDMGPCPPGLTLDRIDNDGHYAPGNCRWATRKQQAANTRQCVWVTLNGQPMILMELARHFGVKYSSLQGAVHRRGEDPVAAAKRLAALRP